ncbi:MAG: hypothetical protein H6Q74_1394 [Firmicutes bacterium]|nr:hypothetical protein [Bacillota bacterium]
MIEEGNIIKKIFVAIFMGLCIYGGAVNSNICNAYYNEYDIIQWNYQREKIQVDVANTIATSQDVVAYFMEKGYSPSDIVMAGLLAGQNNSTNVHISNINEILLKKTNNNSWQDIATNMGVDQKTYNQYMERAKR